MSTHTKIDMDLSNRTVEGLIRFGEHTTTLIPFNDPTTMADVNYKILEWFKKVLPPAFHIEFYSNKSKMFLHLDENVLNSELNPFQFNSTNNSEEVINIMDCVELFIVEDSSPTHQVNSQTNSLSNSTSSNELSPALHNIVSSTIFDSASTLPSSISNTVIPHNSISTDDADDDMIEENSAIKNPLNPQIDIQISTASSNEHQLRIQSNDEIDTQPIRAFFSHDVHPEQKDHYLTNKFKIDDRSNKKNVNKKSNGGLSYVQGFKTEGGQKKIQVLPQIRISQKYINKNNNLLIYAVYEEQKDGVRIWYKHFHKGFLLPGHLHRDAKFSNPIKLALNNLQPTTDGNFKLKIYMLTKRDKTPRSEEKIYQLSEQETIEIHQAKHVAPAKTKPILPVRLLIVLQDGNSIDWSTVGLSNFIQPPKKNQSIASNTVATARNTSVPSETDCDASDSSDNLLLPGENFASIGLNAVTTAQNTSGPSYIDLDAFDLFDNFLPPEDNFTYIDLNAVTTAQITSPARKRKKI